MYPEIDISNLDRTEIRKSLGEPLRLQCTFAGIPVPAINWYKDDVLFQPVENQTRISLNERNTLLDVKFIRSEDEGTYRCQGSNRLGSASRVTTLKITSK